MSEVRNPDHFSPRAIDLTEARCIIGDVYRAIVTYQEWVAKNGFNTPWVERFLHRLYLANEDMRTWAALHLHLTREESAIYPDFIILVQGVRDGADQIRRTIEPLFVKENVQRGDSRPMRNSGYLRLTAEVQPVRFPPAIAPLLANTLSCLGILKEIRTGCPPPQSP